MAHGHEEESEKVQMLKTISRVQEKRAGFLVTAREG